MPSTGDSPNLSTSLAWLRSRRPLPLTSSVGSPEQPYGIDRAIRDPLGNHIRITQPAAEMTEITDEVKQRWAGENG